jgi:hypothetical protein
LADGSRPQDKRAVDSGRDDFSLPDNFEAERLVLGTRLLLCCAARAILDLFSSDFSGMLESIGR